MQKSQVKTLVSETGRKVEEEKYMIGVDNDVEVVVRYTYDFQTNENTKVVIFQILTTDAIVSGSKQTSGNFSISGFNVSNFNPNYAPIYGEIEETCKVLCPITQPEPII